MKKNRNDFNWVNFTSFLLSFHGDDSDSAERETVGTETSKKTVNTFHDAIEDRANAERAAIFRCFACLNFLRLRRPFFFGVLSDKVKANTSKWSFPRDCKSNESTQIESEINVPAIFEKKKPASMICDSSSKFFLDFAWDLWAWRMIERTLRIFSVVRGSIEVKFELPGWRSRQFLWSWLNRKTLWDRKFDGLWQWGGGWFLANVLSFMDVV